MISKATVVIRSMCSFRLAIERGIGQFFQQFVCFAI